MDLGSYTQFSELPLAALEELKAPVYILDFNWNYLFVNSFVAANLGTERDQLIGQNMWETFSRLTVDPNFLKMKANTEKGQHTSMVVTSPLTAKRMHITGRPLADCYAFVASMLPNKNDLLQELRGALIKKNTEQMVVV
ncbi:MAG: PAS domain-containing protein [Bacteroidota bacterium]